MRRTDLQDTALWAHRAMIERIRKMTPEERLRRTDAMIVEMRVMRRRIQEALAQRADQDDSFAEP